MQVQVTALPAVQGGPERDPAGESGRIAYTVAEVAQLLGKHTKTVYEWVRNGALPSERFAGTIYIPKWALARLVAPDAATHLATSIGGEAA